MNVFQKKFIASVGLVATVSLLVQSCSPRRFNASLSDASGKKHHTSKSTEPVELGTLKEVESDTVPLEEVSGLLRWHDPSAPRQQRALAFSDRNYVVATFEASEKSGQRIFQQKNLSSALKDFGEQVGEDSQWEAAASDGAGSVFLLNESLSVVNVFSPDLSRSTHRIDLSIPSSHTLFEAWEKEPNSRGEGIVLLKNGHVLIAKEKKPPALVEFGPAGNRPLGFDPNTRLGEKESFLFPATARATYVPLKVWFLTKESEKLMPDLSELTVGPDGSLYLLSDKTHSIARVQPTLGSDEDNVRLEDVWKLPSEIEQPEGLIFLDDFSPMVGIDAKKQTTNLFTFKALR